MENSTFPFGKYKGRPVSIVLQDVRYCQWMLRQCDALKNSKYKELRELMQKRVPVCGLCHNDIRGMYACEGDYMKCPGCGSGADSQKIDQNNPKTL
jgi:uncharacterized protein (DUF3820 family)